MSAPNVGLTPSQTVGPFYSDCLLRDDVACSDLAPEAAPDQRITIRGCVYDGAAAPVRDAVLELWQDGSRFGRVGTDADGRFEVTTIKPSDPAAPFISIAIFARGLLNHLYTRIYFADQPNSAGDAAWLRVPAERRDTLLARDEGNGVHRFDIVLQGPGETVFFDFA